MTQRFAGEVFIDITVIAGRAGRRRRHDVGHAKQLTTTSQLVLSPAIAEEAVIADALEAAWQDVDQEPANEFVSCRAASRFSAFMSALNLPRKPVFDSGARNNFDTSAKHVRACATALASGA